MSIRIFPIKQTGRADGGVGTAGEGALPRPVRGGGGSDHLCTHAVHPISSVLQTEYSLWSRDPEDELIPTVRELGIGYVAYSPLGRGFLTGQLRRFEDLAYDWRRHRPRFQGENFQKNLELVERVKEIAATEAGNRRSVGTGLADGSAGGRPIPGTSAAKTWKRTWPRGITLNCAKTWNGSTQHRTGGQRDATRI